MSVRPTFAGVHGAGSLRRALPINPQYGVLVHEGVLIVLGVDKEDERRPEAVQLLFRQPIEALVLEVEELDPLVGPEERELEAQLKLHVLGADRHRHHAEEGSDKQGVAV